MSYPLANVGPEAVYSANEATAILSELLGGQKEEQVATVGAATPPKVAPAAPVDDEPNNSRKRSSSQTDALMEDADDDSIDDNAQHSEDDQESPPAKKRLVDSMLTLSLPSPTASPRQDPMSLLDSQSRMPPPGSVEAKAALWRLLQQTDRITLSAISGVLRGALRTDIISALPSEIAYKIFSMFDARTLINSSQVCHSWYSIAQQGSLNFWKSLALNDSLISEREYPKELASLMQQHRLSEDDAAKFLYKRRVMIGRRWNDTNFQPKQITLPGPQGQPPPVITCLQFDDDKIAAGFDDSSITIYETQTGKLQTVLSGHNGGVWAMKYYGNTLASASTDRTVRIWNIRQGRCTHIFRGHISTVRCLEIIEPRQIGTDDEGNAIVYPKEPLLVTGSRDATLFVWKLPLAEDSDLEGPVTEPIDLDEHSNPYLVRVLKGHTGSVRAVTGYANILISGSYDTNARVWDLRTGECKFVLAGHADRIYSCVYDVDRHQCYTGSLDNTVRIWDTDTGECKSILEGHQMLVGLITSSKNALVSAAADWTVRVWDPDSGKPRSVLRGHSSAITCVQNDDYRIVSGSQGMLKLWNAKTGEFIRDLLDDVDGPVWQVKFDYRRCIAAVQKDHRTCIEILDFCPPGTEISL